MSPGADVVDAAVVVAWGRGGVRALGAAREALDRVNVFPVADADTGTNMYLTLLDAVRALPADVGPGARPDEGTPGGAGDLLVRLARGALVGARGNSGVILSEYLRGLALELAEHRTVTGPALAAGLDRAARTARGAVARPAPGTILTAADAAARAAATASEQGEVSPVVVASAARDGARAAARRSTGELDALARAQVLDAGALGLVLVLGALVAALDARGTGAADVAVPAPAAGQVARDDAGAAGTGVSEVLGMMAGMVPVPGSPRESGTGSQAGDEGGEFEVMYVVDVPVDGGAHPAGGRLVEDPAELLRAQLARVGDSVVVVGGPGDRGSGLWQAHVHTDDPMAAVSVGRDALATVRSERDDHEGAARTSTRDDVALRQVRVRHLPGPHEHGHAPDATGHGTGPVANSATEGPGLVAVTAAPGLVADLARAGAVVLLREEPRPLDLSALHRVAVDARATHVALLPGAELPEDAVAALRATLRDDGVETLEVLPAPTDLHVAVALAAAQLVEPGAAHRLEAARSALAGVRVARADTADGPAPEVARLLLDALSPLLLPTPALVTVLADDDVPRPAVDALAAGATRTGAEVVLLRSGRDGGAVTLAVEGPDAVDDDTVEGRA
ncbi:DAK2 domain-containing protein [Cellulosimicrobium cellulans]|uniref:DAK2 domain-containing protein n=1 Tax=Cellulosimicrobium cellulans TaxID=1710 RepID=UPI001963BC01|nr:DAK2 domain-containing protein [Cellulosimicrobium cellulans]MBN0041225.1 DAK2 domain-containing protein [Cellulosimicrobium cellulans]